VGWLPRAKVGADRIRRGHRSGQVILRAAPTQIRGRCAHNEVADQAAHARTAVTAVEDHGDDDSATGDLAYEHGQFFVREVLAAIDCRSP
jgi:hypothetical protein